MSSGNDERVVPSHIAHIVVRSRRFSEMVSWYSAVFLAETIFVNDDLAFLTFDDEHHRIAIVRNDNLKDLDDSISAIDHVAFTYRSFKELFSVYDRLKLHDITPKYSINHGMTTSLYYSDPDSNKVELQVENFATRQEAINFFQSAAFAADPVGNSFDPDAEAAKWRSQP